MHSFGDKSNYYIKRLTLSLNILYLFLPETFLTFFNIITVILIEDIILIIKGKLILFGHHFITGIGMTFIVMVLPDVIFVPI